MPDYKVYIPEAKAPLLYQYKEQFGKDASGMVVGFMENALANASAASSSKDPATLSLDQIYETYFGDIENENTFLCLFETRESARSALKNRVEILSRKHPGICPDVLAQFRKNHPKLAKIQET